MKAGVDEAVVADADTELKLWEEEGSGEDMDNNTERVDVVVVGLEEAGAIVAPHVHTDTHVQTDGHAHEDGDACAQDVIVAIENNGMAPGGNEPAKEKLDDCDEDNVDNRSEDKVCGPGEDDLDACDRFGCDGIESDTLGVEEEYADVDEETNTSDDVEDGDEEVTKNPGAD